MHLIAPLASGINGAASGAAYIYRRGTSSLVTYYEDFEGTTALTQGSSGIALDSNGGAVVYVDNVVTVVVKDSSGATVREFTAGAKESAVEVISRSFNGTDYVSGAAGASKPTTLGAVLDKWYVSAGTLDFKVLVGGVATNLKTAVQGLSDVFYNVQSDVYGAVGDGTTDDYASISAAISAASSAGGGLVVLPPGTYRITQMLTVPTTVSLMGCGAECTWLKLDANTASTYSAVYFPGTSSTHYRFQEMSGLRISCTQVNTVEAIRVKDAYVRIRDVEVIGGSVGFADLLLEVPSTLSPTAFHIFLERCTFSPSSDSLGACINTASASTLGTITMTHCRYKSSGTTFQTSPAAFNVDGSTGVLTIHGGTFDISAATSTNSGYMFSSDGQLMVHGVHFKGPSNGSSYLVRGDALTASTGKLVEDGNNLDGAGCKLIDSSSSLSGLLDQIKLYSRSWLYNDHTSITASSVSIDSLTYGSVLVQKTSGSTLTVNAIDIPIGHRFTLTIWNDGTGGSLTVTLGSVFKGTSMTVANNMMQTAEFVSRAGPSGTVKMYQIGTPRDESE